MGAGADWLAMSEAEREPYRRAVADWPIDPAAVALTASIIRRHHERMSSEATDRLAS